MRLPFRRATPPGSTPPRPRRLYVPLLSTSIGVAIGLLVLVDLLTTIPLLDTVGAFLIEYGLIIAAFALLLGVLNLLTVHLRKIQTRASGWPYSVVLVVTALLLIAVGLVTGPEGALVNWTLNAILLPLESAFFSLLAFFLFGVAYRAMRVNSLESLLLVGSAIIVILGATPVGNLLGPWAAESKSLLMTVPATAGARGLLFGIALGTVVTGLRLIFDGRRYFK